ncbi:MAG TPA: alpha-L-fucosidase [Candidatus Limnocylindrales bacterium]
MREARALADHVRPDPAGGQSHSGGQRLSVERLKAWQALEYGMFIHFGMSTFDGEEFSAGDRPSTHYAPDKLDVDQWVATAAAAGMRYAVLTAKHVAGHCLWPTDLTGYHVGTSGNTTDVVEAFVSACQRHGLMSGLYYCSWDNHHLFGSVPPHRAKAQAAFTTRRYRDFQLAQIEELLTRYGPIGEVWIDIPDVLGADGRREQYDQIAQLAPDAVVVMNAGFRGRWTGSQPTIEVDKVWPTDVLTIERDLPPSSAGGYEPWHDLEFSLDDRASCYVPAEVCDPIGAQWFHCDDDPPRSDAELLGIRLVCRERQASLLLNVPPDRHGRIPDSSVSALERLTHHIDKCL